MRFHYLYHVPYEGPGCLATYAKYNGIKTTATRLYANAPLPARLDADLLVVMGGPMGVHDEQKHSWLKAEKAFIRRALDAGKKALGVCLGAQLLADALGAEVYPGSEREIGWFPVRLTEEGQRHRFTRHFPQAQEVFHWHGDTFDLPAGGVRLFETKPTPNQAFAFGEQAVGLQFHLEVAPADVARMVAHGAEEVEANIASPYVSSIERMQQGRFPYSKGNALAFDLLDQLLEA